MQDHIIQTTWARRAVACIVAVATVTITAVAAPSSAASAATGPATISGRLVSDGQALPGVTIIVWHREWDVDTWNVVARTTTSSTGSYRLTGVEVNTRDSYQVLWDDPERRIVGGGQRVVPVPGKTVMSDVVARPGSTITGSVGYVNGAQPTHARVVIHPDVAVEDGGTSPDEVQPYPFEIIPRTVAVASDGSFRITGLPRGDYRLEHTDTTHYFFDICHDGRRERRDACDHVAPLTLGIGTSRTVPRRTFVDRSAQIIGLVTDAKGAPVAADVEVFRKGAKEPASRASTVDGVWRAIDLPPSGDWLVRVEPWSSGFQTRWFRDAVLRRDAGIVPTTNGEKVVRRNVVLPRS